MEINTNKTKSILHLGKFDISALSHKVALLKDNEWDTPEDYMANYNKNSKSALNSTQHIIFRFSNKQIVPFSYKSYSRWAKWKAILLPLLDQATKSYGYRNGVYTRVMLAKLPQKSFIPPHIDGDKTGSIPHKIHIPIKTNINSFFYLNGEKHHLKKGQAYEVNNSITHSVANSGDTDRIHLIFEYLDYSIQSEIIKKQISLQ